MKIAYSGIEGAFASIAARRIFPDEELISYGDFRSAYDSVEKGDCDYAVLPIENSYAGEVGQVTDLMFQGNLFINGVYTLNVVQNLLGVKGSEVSEIKKVISHPQALDQCSDYLQSHGIKTEEAVNTALAAKHVSELNDKTVAAIASEETALLYNLEILERGINGYQDNSTRFAILSKKEDVQINTGSDNKTFILMFAVKNEAGMLAKAIDVIGRHGFSMNALRSRHLKSLSWQYYFYAEIEGDPESDEISRMLNEMSQYCVSLKQLGTTGENSNELI